VAQNSFKGAEILVAPYQSKYNDAFNKVNSWLKKASDE
jgi:hypothetical protein